MKFAYDHFGVKREKKKGRLKQNQRKKPMPSLTCVDGAVSFVVYVAMGMKAAKSNGAAE